MYPGESKPAAIIYRHGDGYPEGLGLDLQRFVKEVKETVDDKRFDDACYLAAKWVVWDACQMSKYTHQAKKTPLAFLSVGIVSQDPGDIEYRYRVVCDGKPTITCETREGKRKVIPKLK